MEFKLESILLYAILLVVWILVYFKINKHKPPKKKVVPPPFSNTSPPLTPSKNVAPLLKRDEIIRRDSVTNLSDLKLLTKEGYLQKKASNFRLNPWQKRYFVIKGHYLSYYSDEKKEHHLAAIDIKFIKDLKLDDMIISFNLIGVHDYILQSNSRAAAQDWYEKIKSISTALKSAIGDSHGNTNDEFRTFCKNQDEINSVYELNRLVPNADHFTTLRFLRARKGDIEEGSKMLKDYMAWRERTFPLDLSEDIMEELRQGKCYARGRDKDGHIVCVIRVIKMPRGSYKSLEVAVDAMVWCFEWMCNSTLLKSPMDTWTLLFDTRGAGFNHIDPGVVQAFAEVLQSRYPERLHKLIAFPSNAFVRTAWNGIKHFFDPITVGKVALVANVEELKDYIDEKNLSVDCGGTDGWVFNADQILDHFKRNDMTLFEGASFSPPIKEEPDEKNNIKSKLK